MGQERMQKILEGKTYFTPPDLQIKSGKELHA
jgi:hypothetical protein